MYQARDKLMSDEGAEHNGFPILQDVNLLTWLSLANNSVKSIENLQQNVHLEHLDLSGNAVSAIPDLTFLKNLKTLMLHKNKISSLRYYYYYNS